MTSSRPTRSEVRSGDIARDLKRVRNMKPLLVEIRHSARRRSRRYRSLAQHHYFRGRARIYTETRQDRCGGNRQGGRLQADRLSETRRQVDLRQADGPFVFSDQPRRRSAGPSEARGSPHSHCRSTCLCTPSRRSAIARRASTKSCAMIKGTRNFRSTRRIASTAKPAISRTRARISTGSVPRAAAAPIMPGCKSPCEARMGRE